MKRFGWLLGATLVILVLWVGGWLAAAGFVRAEIAKLATAQPAIECQKLDIAGFPFRFDITCASFSLVDGDITLSAPEVKATALIYRPTHVQAFFTGPALYADAFFGSARQLDFDNGRASFRLDGFKPARFSLVANKIALTDSLFDNSLIVSADHMEAHLFDVSEAGLPGPDRMNAGLALRAERLDAPGLQLKEGRVLIDATIANLPADIRMWGQAGLLMDWQRAGGVLELVRASYVGASADLEANGNLFLSNEGLIEGKIEIASKGMVEKVQKLAPGAFGQALLTQLAPQGAFNHTLFAENGVLRIGLIPLGAIGPLF